MLDHIRILPFGGNLSGTLTGVYNYNLVPLSLLMSIVGAYVALEIASKIARSQAVENRSVWLWGGALALGLGAW